MNACQQNINYTVSFTLRVSNMSSRFNAVIIGASAGGLKALSVILPVFPDKMPVAIIIVTHRLDTPDTYLTEILSKLTGLPVSEAEHLENILPGHIYLAPAGYHLLIDEDYCFNLSVDPRVNSSRPSIDVAFETAAEVYGSHLIGVVLTGANSDGALGLKKIKYEGGYTIVQDPKTAESAIMPMAAIQASKADYVGTLEEIAHKICTLCAVEAKIHG